MRFKLLCDDTVRPLTVGMRPRFTWIAEGAEGNYQMAYRLCIAEDASFDSCVYDSEKVQSAESVAVEADCQLVGNTRYLWRVTIWDDAGQEYTSQTEYFETALLSKEAWKAKWIDAGNHYRTNWAMEYATEFACEKIKRAKAFICAPGTYTWELNGVEPDNRRLEAAQTDYTERVLYSVYDVTELIRNKNTVKVTLGDGWYHQSQLMDGGGEYGNPCLLFQLEIETEDGALLHIISDESWKVTYSSTTYNNIYIGEVYDGRIQGPDMPVFSASLCEGPMGSLEPEKLPPVRITKELSPVRISMNQDGVHIYDFGENMAGVVRLHAYGVPGNRIVMRFGEALDENGNLDVDSTGVFHISNIQTLIYTVGERGEFVWEPRFTYFGFRYVELTGLHGVPETSTLTALKLNNDLEQCSDFSCSEAVLNDMYRLAKNTFTSNAQGTPSDCPAREKCGWTGDTNVVGEFILPIYDCRQFYSKYLGDIRTSYRETGTFYNIVPGKRRCGETVPSWGGVLITLAWNCYMQYGDTKYLSENYDTMEAYMEWTKKDTTDYICNLNAYPLGDWCAPYHYNAAEHSVQINTAYYYYCAKLLGQIAEVLGKDASGWTDLAGHIKTAFNSAFYHAFEGSYGTETLNAMCVMIGLCEEGQEERLASWCNDDVIRHKYHTTCGHIGLRYIYSVLSRYGYNETVEKVLSNSEAPSFKAQIDAGATTLWETFEMDIHNQSLNHPFKGGYCSWLYEDILGVSPSAPGYREFTVCPRCMDIVPEVKGYIDTARGRISVSYRKENYIEVEVPFGTDCRLILPNREEQLLSCGSHRFSLADK